MKKVAVVILNWNGSGYLKKYLPSVIEHSVSDDVDVFVADNGSDDDSLEVLKEQFPQVRIIQLDKNYGFAGGYNKALSQVKAEYYVILNSDVEVTANWINPLIKHMEKDSKMAAAMPKIKSYNDKEYFEHAGASGGFIDKYGYTFCRGRIFNRVEKDQGQYDDATEVFWATGACMFIKAELFHKIGGFDHNYFAHMEEIDLCWRLKNNGFKIYCFPEVEVFHKGGGALPYNNPFKVYLNFRNNLITLYKNLPEKKYRRIILMRFLLDMLAVIMFLLTFRFKHCFAVCRAYISLIKMFSYYKNIRKELVNINSFVEPVYKRSIVFKYWIENKKSYSKLKF